MQIRCPHCLVAFDSLGEGSWGDLACPSCGQGFSLAGAGVDVTHTYRPGVEVLGRFELLEQVGAGRYGTVWKARDTQLARIVAVKIPRQRNLSPTETDLFLRDARAAAQLKHPRISAVHEVGRENETVYIVTDFVDGADLDAWMTGQPLSSREAAELMVKVAEAVDHANERGVFHRDLKPSNIMLDRAGEPYVIDFGLARREVGEQTLTVEGQVLGTPAYMSPEQARGEGHRADGRSDVYSLGVVLFKLLTGELPFRGASRMLIVKILQEEPPALRTLNADVPRDLETITLKCLEKDASKRYQKAGELAADLRRYLSGEPIHARPVGRLERTWRWCRRHAEVASLLAATIVILLTASVVSSYFGWRAAVNAARADQQALAVTDTLYESLLQEMQLTREVRRQGYGQVVHQLVARARALPTAGVDPDELRRQLVLSMGDFVAYPPRVIRPPGGGTSSICLSRDGREIVVGSHEGRLAVYDAETGIERYELDSFTTDPADPAEVQSIAMTADGSQLVAAARNGSARVWRRSGERWKLQHEMDIGAEAHSVFLSPSGELLVYLNRSVAEVWDVGQGARLRSLETEADWTMRNAVIDLPNRRVAGSYLNTKADTVGWVLWSLDTGERSHHQEMPSLGPSYSNAIDAASDGSRLAIGFDEALLVYDVTPGLTVSRETGIQGFDSTKAVAFSAASPYLAVANIRGWVTIWNSVTGRQLAKLHHPQGGTSREDLSFSGDGTRLASSNAESIYIWDLTRAEEKTVLNGHSGGIPCAVFSPDGELLVTGGKDYAIRFWNPSTGELVGQPLKLHEKVQALAFSSDGELLAVGCWGPIGAPNLKVVDVRSRTVIYEDDPVLGDVHAVAWADSDDGRYLGACGGDGVALWRIAGREPLSLDPRFRLELEKDRSVATILSPDGRWMVWTLGDKHLEARDLANQRDIQLHAPNMHQGWHGVTFLPDGKSIIYISETNSVQIWDIAEDRHVDSFGEPGTFNAPQLALSPNGEWLAALTQADTVSIWHLPTKAHVFSLRPEGGTVWSLGWDPKSQRLAVGQSDGGLAVWHLPRIQQKLRDAGLAWLEGP